MTGNNEVEYTGNVTPSSEGLDTNSTETMEETDSKVEN